MSGRPTRPETYRRLVELKNEYDPTNLFRLNQNIARGVPGRTAWRSPDLAQPADQVAGNRWTGFRPGPVGRLQGGLGLVCPAPLHSLLSA